MGTKTKIEWTEATWNPVRGCSIVSEGCRNCYAMRMAHRSNRPGGAYEGLTRIGAHGPTWTGDIRFVPEALEYPLKLKKPHRIFVNSMSDLFHESLDEIQIGEIFAIMAMCPQHTFQILTKRPERMYRILDTARICFDYDEPLPNVMLGVSVEDQKTADERIPWLMKTPAALRWISAEPLLGPIDLATWLCFCPVQCEGEDGGSINCAVDGNYLDWVVVGGESGPGARPMHPDWVRSIRDQCTAENVPFFFKQWGAWVEELFIDAHDTIPVKRRFAFDDNQTMVRVGKKAAGNLLNGRQHLEYPA